jgi:hypothetical protein
LSDHVLGGGAVDEQAVALGAQVEYAPALDLGIGGRRFRLRCGATVCSVRPLGESSIVSACAARRPAPRGRAHRLLARLAQHALDADRHVDLAILEMRALLDAVLAAGEDRVVELLDDGSRATCCSTGNTAPRHGPRRGARAAGPPAPPRSAP